VRKRSQCGACTFIGRSEASGLPRPPRRTRCKSGSSTSFRYRTPRQYISQGQEAMNCLRSRFLHLFTAYIAFIVSCVISSFFFPFGHFSLARDNGEYLWVPFASVALGIVAPLIVSIFVYRLMLRLYPPKTFSDGADNTGAKKARYIHLLIVFLLLVTWIFGAPAVQNALQEEAVEYYKSAVASNRSKIESSYPYSHVSVSLPVFPGILLSYREYQVAPLWGWGGWEVHVWYIFGSIRLISLMLWIS
jgi:cytochrome b561